MDGENNGKPYYKMDDLGVPLFLETPISENVYFCFTRLCFTTHWWVILASVYKCLCLPAKQASYEQVIQGSIIWFFGNNVSLWWATLEWMEEGFWAKMTIMLNTFSLDLPLLCARFWVRFPKESLQFLHPKVSFLQFFHQAWLFLHISDKNQVKIKISGNIDVVFLCGH